MEAYPIDYERIVQELYEAVLRPGDTALDVGAHLGRHTLPLARAVLPGGKVFAFEPLDECRVKLAARLHADPALADAVSLLPFALGDRPGERGFVIAEDALPFSGFHEADYPGGSRLRRTTVRVDTIDNVFFDLPGLRYVKIDAEGAELAILRGAEGTLARHRPAVSFEFNLGPAAKHGATPAEVSTFWRRLGYAVYGIDGRPLDAAAFDASARRGAIWDYAAVPAEDAGLVLAVRETLNRARVNWLAVHAYLGQAKLHAPVGSAVPPLRSFRGPLHGLARGAARLVLWLARVVTGPQRECNESLVRCLGHLAAGLERADEECRRRDARIRDLEARVLALELCLTQRRGAAEDNGDGRDVPAGAGAERRGDD